MQPETTKPKKSPKRHEEAKQASMPGTDPAPEPTPPTASDVLGLTIEATALLRLLNAVKGATAKKTTMPILACVLLEARGDRLTVSATDLELSLSTSAVCDIHSEGELAISCRVLTDIVKDLPKDPVRLQASDRHALEVRCGKARFRVNGLAGSNFPRLPQRGAELHQVDAGALAELLGRTAYAICQDSTRYNLCGLRLEALSASKTVGGEEVLPGLRGVATDGHRLAIADARWPSAPPLPSVTIPTKTVKELQRLLGEGDDAVVRVGVHLNHLELERGDVRLIGQLVDGQFPEWSQVVPPTAARTSAVTLERAGFRAALHRVEALAAVKGQMVRLDLRGPNVAISAQAIDVGEFDEEVPSELDGKAQSVGSNVSYLLEALDSLDEEKVTLHVVDALAPVVLVGADDNGREVRAIVMPMRV